MHCTSSRTLHGGSKIGTGYTIPLYIYCVPHPYLHMEDRWLCLIIIYFTMLSLDTHLVEGAAGFVMILSSYYILSCLRRPFVSPRWPYLPVINISCIHAYFSHKSKTYRLGPTWGKKELQTCPPTHDSPWSMGGVCIHLLRTKCLIFAHS